MPKKDEAERRDEITVTLSPYSASEFVDRVAHQLSRDTMETIGAKVEEILGDSIEALVRAKLDEYLSMTIEKLLAETYTPTDESGVEGDPTALEDHVRSVISHHLGERCTINRSGDIVKCDQYTKGESRFKALVRKAALDAADNLVASEIAEHTAKMKQDATEAVKALVAEHIVIASQKRQLNGGLPT